MQLELGTCFHMFPRNFPVNGEVADLLQQTQQQTRPRQLVTDLLQTIVVPHVQNALYFRQKVRAL